MNMWNRILNQYSLSEGRTFAIAIYKEHVYKTICHLLQCKSLLLARTIGQLLVRGRFSYAQQWRRRRRGRGLREKIEKHINSSYCIIFAWLHFEKVSMCVQTWLKERNTNVWRWCSVIARWMRVCGCLMSRVKLVCPLWIIHNSWELIGHKQPGGNIKANVCNM